MSNTTENIDTKAFENLANSLHNVEYTIGNFSNTIQNISSFIGKYDITKISIPYNFLIIGFIGYVLIFLILYNKNYLCKKISNKIFPSNSHN